MINTVLLDGMTVGGRRPYVIAEIGNNHMGEVEEAKRLIEMARDAGANAVKFQKRDNATLFTRAFYNSPYHSEAAYADTYGAHRDYFEFSLGQYLELKEHADLMGITMIATAFDLPSVDFLEQVDIPYFKVASAGIQNPLLLERIAATGKPVVMSVGGADWDTILMAESKFPDNPLIILHCTASYPAKPKDMGMWRVVDLKKTFPDRIIGFSDHDDGLALAVMAYTLGARVFEKHITMSHSNRGTDHAFSLEYGGLRSYVNNLHEASEALRRLRHPLETEKRPIYKMGYGVYPSRFISAGTEVSPSELCIKSPAEGLEGWDYYALLGRRTTRDLSKEEPLSWEDFE